jgi:hypothetical protein
MSAGGFRSPINSMLGLPDGRPRRRAAFRSINSILGIPDGRPRVVPRPKAFRSFNSLLGLPDGRPRVVASPEDDPGGRIFHRRLRWCPAANERCWISFARVALAGATSGGRTTT